MYNVKTNKKKDSKTIYELTAVLFNIIYIIIVANFVIIIFRRMILCPRKRVCVGDTLSKTVKIWVKTVTYLLHFFIFKKQHIWILPVLPPT